MRKLFERIETMMAAASFAEEGEFETAKQIMKDARPRKIDRPSSYDYKRPSTRPTLRAN